MGRRGPTPEFFDDGLLVVDKPPSLTSNDVVERVKRAVKPRRIGHTGTLDPFATGVLVLCINKATKLAGYLLNDDKTYQGVMYLGVETDTYDLTGQVKRTRPVKTTDDEIILMAERFKGAIEQTPPAYSAIKQNGEALYKKARRGEEVEVDARQVTIHRLEITNIELPRVHFEVCCSKGTYIRSLAYDWGKALGCGAHLEELRRTQAGPFTIDDSLNLGLIESLAKQHRLSARLKDPAKGLPDWPTVTVNDQSWINIGQGKALTEQELGSLDASLMIIGQKLKIVSKSGELVALAQMASTVDGEGLNARPIRVLQINS